MKNSVFLPTLLEQTHIKIFLKGLIRLWAEVVGCLLDLRGYLLGEKVWRNFNEAIADNDEENEPGGAGFLRGEPESDDEADAENNENGNSFLYHGKATRAFALPYMRIPSRNLAFYLA